MIGIDCSGSSIDIEMVSATLRQITVTTDVATSFSSHSPHQADSMLGKRAGEDGERRFA